MNNRKPLIGITTGYDYDKHMMYLKEGYYDAIYKCGGLAIAIPSTCDETVLLEILNYCDGILLSGGPDVDAKLYGEGNMPYNGDISPIRDASELFIAKKSIEMNKPLLAICRGIQIINVAMGGTLYQDIYMQNKECSILKHSQSAPKWYPTHEINIKKDSWVWKTFMNDSAYVNSFHHQAVKEIAQGFEVTSRSTDGIIEAIEYVKNRFCVGVQWHPELMWQKNEEFLNIFKEFVLQAGKLEGVKG
jgi:putative glutamine amidotransferase